MEEEARIEARQRWQRAVAHKENLRYTFQRAVRKVIYLLRLRRRFAALGQYLQVPQLHDLWSGLERKKGKLVRHRPAVNYVPSTPDWRNARQFRVFIGKHWRIADCTKNR